MKTADRNFGTHVDIIRSFIYYSDLPEEEKRIITSELKRYITVQFACSKWVEPVITKFCTDWYREFYRMIDNRDPYRGIKEVSRLQSAKLCRKFKPKNFREAILFSILGNKIDYGSLSVHTPDFKKLERELGRVVGQNLDPDDSEKLKERIKKSKRILFLADNVGEIEFDKFLLDYIKKNSKAKVYIAGKESPMLNDACVSDLKDVGIGKLGTIISTGSDCFGLHEEYVSPRFKKEMKQSDLIIAKGQAYLEFFTEYDLKNIFNILYSKHPIIGRNFFLKGNKLAVISSERYAGSGGRTYYFS